MPYKSAGDLEPLGDDACQADRSAPCLYWHTKIKALNGERDKLTREELTLVGVDVWRPPGRGWHAPQLPASDGADDDAPIADGRLALLQHILSLEPARHTDY